MTSAFKDYVKNKYSRPAPLKGLRVLEVCTLLFGPAGPSFLATMGAEVIKIELPPVGDVTRSLNPFGWFYKEQGPMFMHINPSKLYMALDLHKEEAQNIFKELCGKADVVEFNLRPGVTKRWNIGYEDIRKANPGIIYVEKNGFGQWGLYAEQDRPSNDGAAQALSGYAWMSSFAGRPPLKQSIWVCDVYGALMGEAAVLAALHHKRKTGKGQYIEMSQSENIMRAMTWIWPYQQMSGKGAEPSGNRDLCICPADTFLCKDGKFAALAAPAPDEFKGLCEAMGQPDLAKDARFRDHSIRLKNENAIAILKIIADWAVTKTADEIEGLGKKHGFAATRLHNAVDENNDPHRRGRDFVKMIDDPMYGRYPDHEFPVMMSKSPPKNRWTVRPVGFDNDYILTTILGRSQEQIETLYTNGVVGKWKDQQGRRPPADWDGKSGAILRR
ncbi:MAG: CoA transferase [Syntrophales bacterium]|nr:CoA transferase [Syntrophales bacterium]MDD5532554.1 CoA transferase [Syntrophales bacterium]